MTNEELKVRAIGAFVLIIAFTILVPLLISGENVNRDKKYVSRIEQQHNYAVLQNQSQSVDDSNLEIKDQRNTNVAPLEQEQAILQNSSSEKEDLDNIRIVENTPPQQDKTIIASKPTTTKTDSVNQQTAKKQNDNSNKKTEPVKPTKTTEEKKQTITVINQQTNKKTVVEVKQKPEPKTNKPDPNYIYDANKKENKPIVTTNPTTGNINRYQLQAGVYSSMTNTKNVENEIKAACGTTKIVPVTSNGKRMFKLLCGNSTDINAIQNIQKKIQGKVTSTIIRAN